MKKNELHPSPFEIGTFILIIITSILGAIIGLEIISSLGVTPNTSIIGALIAMVLARLPLNFFKKFKSIHRQNLVETSISSATFGAANSLFIPIGIPYVMGRTDLIIPTLIGATLAMYIDTFMLYRLFDSDLFPAQNSWAPGVATAESILAGDKGGKRAGLLGVGGIIGIIGSSIGIPMSAFGVAFIGNAFALGMFGLGLLINQYALPLFKVDISSMYIPHGIMVGAGVVALIQAGFLIFKNKSSSDSSTNSEYTRSPQATKKTLSIGYIGYLVVAIILALLGGLISKMSIGMLAAFLVYAAFAAIVHEIIVGIAAMHSGWFPAFAVALITLLLGILFGFPPVSLAILVGFTTATGPAFADMGYDLKTGYILRGNGKDKRFELDGRKQQYYAGLIAFTIAVVVVALSYHSFFGQKMFPPIDVVYVSSIKAGATAKIAEQLAIWAIPGAIIQFIGGPSKQLGIMLATGLLISTPNASWAVLVGLTIRFIVGKIWHEKSTTPMTIMAAGFIAGDALYSFGTSTFNTIKK
ncbi:OPT/YSL family transporter [Oenococcus oeni]|uniref:OPT/YSL family transporter n=1 Tax=Oenococcus oeni TaxID=1247 RepID=UPI0010AF1350|nr:OPT/YSL family transporter [Oenococcus oeni]SYW09709.1 putative Oligopeptide transporter, OPT superfamily [Oenococcus oeni]